jgi:hypothetical protein
LKKLIETRTCLDNAQIFINWMIKKHPEILSEYYASETFKALTKDNLRSSLTDAMKTLEKQ